MAALVSLLNKVVGDPPMASLGSRPPLGLDHRRIPSKEKGLSKLIVLSPGFTIG